MERRCTLVAVCSASGRSTIENSVVLAGLGVDRKGSVDEDDVAIQDILVVGNRVVPGWSPRRAWLGRKGIRFPPTESTSLLCSGRLSTFSLSRRKSGAVTYRRSLGDNRPSCRCGVVRRVQRP